MDRTNPKLYASFHARMLASVIDTLLSAVFLAPVFQVSQQLLGLHIYKPMREPSFNPADVVYTDVIALLLQNMPVFLFEFGMMLVVILLFWYCRSATPGKMLLKMKIVDAGTLEKASFKQHIIRFLGYTLSTIPFGLGFIWIYIDKKTHQGWHDKLAETVVIHPHMIP
jgi:uncharacterized RDD family membrane protein YckC